MSPELVSVPLMIPTELLNRVREVEIQTRRLAEDHLAGAYRSVFKGRGLEFEDVRAYTAGDDVRLIDWNITARMNAPFVREMKEERELSVLLVVDISASADFPAEDSSKRMLALEAAACLAFSAVANGDKVGLLLFGQQVERFHPPRKGRLQAMRLLSELLHTRPELPGTSITAALRYLHQVQPRRAIIFLISDFWDESAEQLLGATAARHDLIPLLLSDWRERQLPDVGVVSVRDAESGEIGEIDTSDPVVRTEFERRSNQRRSLLRRRFQGWGTDLVELKTEQACYIPIRRFMEMRLNQRIAG